MNVPGRPAFLLAVAFLLAGCGPANGWPALPSPAVGTATPPPSGSSTAAPSGGSPNPADLAVYAQIESQVQALRGLTAKSPVTPVLLDSQGVRDWLTKANAAQTNHQAMADQSRLFVDLGLLPAGSSLEQMEIDLQAGQVIGFYDTDSKGLYVLSESGGVGGMQKLTFSHEYTHALQDQNFGLDKLGLDAPDQSDRDLARLAVPEGDATEMMSQWMIKYMSPIEMMQVAGESLIGPQADQLAKAPRILSETLLFPYESGLSFVEGIYHAGGWAAVNALYANPPDSTSQILHPDLYTARVKPVAVTVPAVPSSLAGWKMTMQDTLGELELRIWLEGETPSASQSQAATAATSDWGGDRVGLYEGPNGTWAVVMRTAWRTVAGTAAFQSAATSMTGNLPGPAVVCADGSGVALYVASDATALEAFAPCRPPL
ncbi:MAG TPA: hypothetical protein VF349_03370 [Candidatus Limnocylindrales bacterium]